MKSTIFSILFRHDASKAFLLLLIVGYAFIGCQRTEVDPGFGPNGEPRLLNFSVSGIPGSSINIDQVHAQIIVTIPTTFTANSVVPTVELTPNTSVDYANSTLFGHQASNWNRWELSSGTLRIVRKEALPQTTIYQVVVRAAGPLAFAPYTGSRTITMEPETYEINFPIYNFRDSVATGYIQLINVATSQTREFSVYPSQSCGSEGTFCASLSIEPGFVEPGEYRVALRKSNGRRAELDGTLSFQKGKLALAMNSTMLNLNPLSTGYIRVYGYNLYVDSQLSLQLINAVGEKFTAPLQRSYRASVADFTTPSGLKAGYYYAQLLQNNQPTSLSTRIVVADRTNELVIYNIFPWTLDTSPVNYLLTPSASFSAPVILKRGQTYSIPTSIEAFAQEASSSLRTQLLLTSTTNRTEQYSVKSQTGSWWLFNIPPGLPLGRYQLTYQQLKSGGTFDALQLERDVIIE